MESSEIVDKHLPTFKKHFVTLNLKWSNLQPAHKTIFKLLPLFLILVAIPLTVNLSQRQQNVNSDAAKRCWFSNGSYHCVAPVTTPVPTGCLIGTGSFKGQAISPQTGVFEANFDQTPNKNLTDGVTGFSPIPAGAYTDMAVIVLFSNQGFITARNGENYQAVNVIPYAAGSTYHFRLDVDIPNHKYNAYVTPPGLPEQIIGTNFSFRSEQANTTNLSYWNLINSSGTHTACNLIITSTLGSTPTPIQGTSVNTPTPTKIVTSLPTPTPLPIVSGKVVNVSSIAALKTALADNSVDEIVVANGTYHVSPSNQVNSDSLWIGSATSGGIPFNTRTRPIIVRAATMGGVIFNGGGGSAYGGLSFEDGAHDQTWDGFVFANMAAVSTGIIEVGGYSPRRTPYNITVRNITILSSCTGRATTASGNTLDHGIYVANSLTDGPHNLLFENITVHGEGNLASAIQFYHGDASNPGAHDVTIRNLTVTNTQQAVILWNETLKNITIDGLHSTGAKAYAIRYEPYGEGTGGHASGIVISNDTSVGPHWTGFPGGLYSSLGSSPIGLTQTNDSLN